MKKQISIVVVLMMSLCMLLSGCKKASEDSWTPADGARDMVQQEVSDSSNP